MKRSNPHPRAIARTVPRAEVPPALLLAAATWMLAAILLAAAVARAVR